MTRENTQNKGNTMRTNKKAKRVNKAMKEAMHKTATATMEFRTAEFAADRREARAEK